METIECGCAAVCDVPLFENNLVFFFPMVLEIRGELMPDREDCVGWNLLFSCLRFHWEKHRKVQEPNITKSHNHFVFHLHKCWFINFHCLRLQVVFTIDYKLGNLFYWFVPTLFPYTSYIIVDWLNWKKKLKYADFATTLHTKILCQYK